MLNFKTSEEYHKKTALLFVPVWEGQERAGLPKELAALLASRIKEADFSGKAKKRFIYFADEHDAVPRRVVFVGLGKAKNASLDSMREAGAILATAAQELKQKQVALLVTSKLDLAKHIKPMLDGYLLKTDISAFKKTGEEEKELKESLTEELQLVLPKRQWQKLAELAADAKVVMGAVAYARSLGAASPSFMTPSHFAQEAKSLAKKHAGLSVKVWGKEELEAKGFGMLTAVGRGGANEPKLVIMEWNPKKQQEAPLALVGKGITFDSGGYNIKPGGFIEYMHLDMSGAAAVLASIKALAELKIPKRVVGIMPLCENLISGSAYKPADVLTSYAGKTVEVVDTDAEGRLILGDALAYACQEFKPKAVVDLATLTGACVVALGEFYAGLFGNNKALKQRIKQAAEQVGEPVWELPLDHDFREAIKSKIADLKNLADSRWAGASTAAAFLEAFITEKTHWAHHDIAGPAMRQAKRVYDAPFRGTGFGVQILIELARKF